MDAGEDTTTKVTGSSLLESMLTYDSTGQLPPRASPSILSASQTTTQMQSKSWGSREIAAEDSSNVTVRLPIHTVSTSFGVLGSGSLNNLKRTVVGRPVAVKTDLSASAGRVPTQRKNPSVKLKHLTATSVFAAAVATPTTTTVKGFKSTHVQVTTQNTETQESDSVIGSIQQQQQQQDSCAIVSLQSDALVVGIGGGGGGSCSSSSSSGGATSSQENELELIEETWPGKVCAFCNLGERSQLGQGEMLRLEVGADFENQRQSTLHSEERLQSLAANAGAGSNKNGSSTGSSLLQQQQQQPSLTKKPRLTLKGRRTSSFDASQTCSELQEELNAVGYAEEPDLLGIVEPCGYFYAHRMCATWSKGVTVSSNTSDGSSVMMTSSPQVTGADTALIRAASLRCHLCGSFGASLSCQQTTATNSCRKSFHFPCAVSCGVSFSLFHFSIKFGKKRFHFIFIYTGLFECEKCQPLLPGSHPSRIDISRPDGRPVCRLSFSIQRVQPVVLRHVRQTLSRRLRRIG